MIYKLLFSLLFILCLFFTGWFDGKISCEHGVNIHRSTIENITIKRDLIWFNLNEHIVLEVDSNEIGYHPNVSVKGVVDGDILTLTSGSNFFNFSLKKIK